VKLPGPPTSGVDNAKQKTVDLYYTVTWMDRSEHDEAIARQEFPRRSAAFSEKQNQDSARTLLFPLFSRQMQSDPPPPWHEVPATVIATPIGPLLI
jgi:hypothetical protein